MYNEELKRRYIEENSYKYRSEQFERYITFKFTQVEPFERMWEKDVGTFTVSEIITFYKTLCYSSLNTILVLNWEFRKYGNFCLANNLLPDMQNHFMEITPEILSQCINVGDIRQKFITRKDLENELQELYNPSEQFLAMAIFEGLHGIEYCELVNLMPSDFDAKNNLVHLCTGRELKVSDQLISYAKESAEEYNHYIYDSKARFNITKYDESDRHVLKKARNNRGSGSTAQARRILNTLVRIKKYTGNPVYAAKPLMESGRIYMIYGLMQKQKYKDIKDCIIKNKNAIFYRYGRIPSVSNWIMRYGEFFQKYEEGGNHGGNIGENKEW